MQWRGPNAPSVLFAGFSFDSWHDGVSTVQGKLDGRSAERNRLIDIGLTGNVTRSALQIVGHGPVILVAQMCFHHSGQQRCQTTKLRVAKCVRFALVSEQLAICGASAFGSDNDAIPKALDAITDSAEKCRLVEGDLREQNNVGRIPSLCRSKAARTGNPAGVSAHDLKNENLSGSGTH